MSRTLAEFHPLSSSSLSGPGTPAAQPHTGALEKFT